MPVLRPLLNAMDFQQGVFFGAIQSPIIFQSSATPGSFRSQILGNDSFPKTVLSLPGLLYLNFICRPFSVLAIYLETLLQFSESPLTVSLFIRTQLSS